MRRGLRSTGGSPAATGEPSPFPGRCAVRSSLSGVRVISWCAGACKAAICACRRRTLEFHGDASLGIRRNRLSSLPGMAAGCPRPRAHRAYLVLFFSY